MPFYAVANGRTSGIFETWEACKQEVDGFSGAKYKKFKNREQALNFISSNCKYLVFYLCTLQKSWFISFLACSTVSSSSSQLPCTSGTSSIASQNIVKPDVANSLPKSYYAVARGSKPGMPHMWEQIPLIKVNFRNL